MNNILTDIINLIKRRKFVKTAKKKDIFVLGTARPNNFLKTASPQPDEDVNLITVQDFVINNVVPEVDAQLPSVNFERTVAIPISTSTNWPDAAINWYSSATSLTKWTPTAINPKVHDVDLRGRDIRIEVRISAMADEGNPISWALRLTNPLNPVESIDLLTDQSPSSSQLVTIGGSYGGFGPGWTRTDGFFAGANNLDVLFFNNFGVTTGELELYISGNGAGIIITGCGVSFVGI